MQTFNAVAFLMVTWEAIKKTYSEFRERARTYVYYTAVGAEGAVGRLASVVDHLAAAGGDFFLQCQQLGRGASVFHSQVEADGHVEVGPVVAVLAVFGVGQEQAGVGQAHEAGPGEEHQVVEDPGRLLVVAAHE